MLKHRLNYELSVCCLSQRNPAYSSKYARVYKAGYLHRQVRKAGEKKELSRLLQCLTLTYSFVKHGVLRL